MTTAELKLELDPKFLENPVLKSGGHPPDSGSYCIMEARSVKQYGEHTDANPKDCPVLGAFLRRFNDRLPTDELRTELLWQFVDADLSKKTLAVEEKRRNLCLDHAARVMLPTWFELAGFPAQAQALRDLVPVTNDATAADAREALHAARKSLPYNWYGYRARVREVAMAAWKRACAEALAKNAGEQGEPAKSEKQAVAAEEAAVAAVVAVAAEVAEVAAVVAEVAEVAESKYDATYNRVYKLVRAAVSKRLDEALGGAITRTRQQGVDLVKAMVAIR